MVMVEDEATWALETGRRQLTKQRASVGMYNNFQRQQYHAVLQSAAHTLHVCVMMMGYYYACEHAALQFLLL